MRLCSHTYILLISEQASHCTYDATVRRVRATTIAVEKISITYSEFLFIALIIQHAMRMRLIVLSSVTFPAVPHFFPPTLSHKRHDFRG